MSHNVTFHDMAQHVILSSGITSHLVPLYSIMYTHICKMTIYAKPSLHSVRLRPFPADSCRLHDSLDAVEACGLILCGFDFICVGIGLRLLGLGCLCPL